MQTLYYAVRTLQACVAVATLAALALPTPRALVTQCAVAAAPQYMAPNGPRYSKAVHSVRYVATTCTHV